MKCLYWRPRKVSRPVLAIIALASLAVLVLVEQFPVARRQPWYAEKLAAAQTASAAMEVIRQERLSRGHTFDPRYDPAMSGMIGDVESITTSNAGGLEAKQTTVNPNFAAAVVQMLKQAGVEAGDNVAVGYTGSFPALNLCVLAALETLECRPLIIASATGSQYGANRPDLFWIDMERLIAEAGVIRSRAHAVSMGGVGDQALRMSEPARGLIRQAIQRNALPFIDEPTYEGSLEARFGLYEELAGGAPIKAYINVGAGSVSVGRSRGMKFYDSGLNLTPPPGATQIDSVMSRFARAGVPVIHLEGITHLARQFDLPIAPRVTPRPGESPLLVVYHENRWLAALALGTILVCTYLGILRGTGTSLWSGLRGRSGNRQDEGAAETRPNLELMV